MINEQERTVEAINGRPLAFVIKMSLFAPRHSCSGIREQMEAAFPGVPLIFVDEGTKIETINAPV